LPILRRVPKWEWNRIKTQSRCPVGARNGVETQLPRLNPGIFQDRQTASPSSSKTSKKPGIERPEPRLTLPRSSDQSGSAISGTRHVPARDRPAPSSPVPDTVFSEAAEIQRTDEAGPKVENRSGIQVTSRSKDQESSSSLSVHTQSLSSQSTSIIRTSKTPNQPKRGSIVPDWSLKITSEQPLHSSRARPFQPISSPRIPTLVMNRVLVIANLLR